MRMARSVGAGLGGVDLPLLLDDRGKGVAFRGCTELDGIRRVVKIAIIHTAKRDCRGRWG